jgi:hypothetical protein
MKITRSDRKTIIHSKNLPEIKKLFKKAGVEAEFQIDYPKTTHVNRRLKVDEMNKLRDVLGLAPLISSKRIESTSTPQIIRGFTGCLVTGHFLIYK